MGIENFGFDRPDVLKKIQASQLRILKELKRVCTENNIRFYLAFGSALGAIRHEGFIPWDDDIDVFMRIEDLKKLKKLQNQFDSRYFIQDHQNENEFGLLIGRVRDSETTLIENDHINRDINHGIYIDIYPLFNFGGNLLKRKVLVGASFICRLLTYNAPPINKSNLSKFISEVILKLLPVNVKYNLNKKIYNWLTNQHESGYLTNIPDISNGKFYPKQWFEEPVMVKFENDEMPISSDYKSYLTYEFGDYMTPPPLNERSIHHSYVFVDCEKPYTTYKGIEYCINNNKENK